MPNTNCLEGFKCPQCGSEARFYISVQAEVLISDYGVEEYTGAEWEADSPCTCKECEHSGIVKEFCPDYP